MVGAKVFKLQFVESIKRLKKSRSLRSRFAGGLWNDWPRGRRISERRSARERVPRSAERELWRKRFRPSNVASALNVANVGFVGHVFH